MKISVSVDPAAPRNLVAMRREHLEKSFSLSRDLGKGAASLRAYLIGLIQAQLQISSAPGEFRTVVAESFDGGTWVDTLANAFQGEARPVWGETLREFFAGDILHATRRTEQTSAKVYFRAGVCREWEWVFLRTDQPGGGPLDATGLAQLAFDLELGGHWKKRLCRLPAPAPRASPPDSAEEKDGLKQRWIERVHQRVGDHPFARNQGQGPSLLQRLLEAVYRLHYLDKNFSTVQPPLPYLPALPLDERWVELQLTDSEANTPFVRSDGIAEMTPRLTLTRFLSLADSALVVGEPGAGKSTMIKWAARHLIADVKNQSLLPLYVPLRTYARWRARHPDGSIFVYLAWFHHLPPDEFVSFVGDIEAGQGPLKGLCKVLLDGWDEVPARMREAVSEDIYAIQHLIPLVLTSRPSGYVGSLHLDVRYQIPPLSYEAMRRLMQEWLRLDGKPELEEILCAHLDRHIAFREMARNPFVLTLLCAIASRDWPKPIPHRKATLYSRLMELARDTCTVAFRHSGYAWSVRDGYAAAAAAFRTLDGSAEGDGYEFELSALAGPGDGEEGRTATLLELSRLITLAFERSDQWSFVHPTVHEFLAAQHLVDAARLDSASAARFEAYAMRPDWLRVMMFVCGLLEWSPGHPAWSGLRAAAQKMDRFGLVALRLAAILSEVACNDGGLSLLGVDIRPLLWEHLLGAPQPRAYAAALVELDPGFASSRLDEIPAGAGAVRIINLLYCLLPPESPEREGLKQALLRVSDQQGLTLWGEIASADLPEYMGFHPLDSPNLTFAHAPSSVGELMRELTRENLPPPIRQSLCIRLATIGGQAAESYLEMALAQAVNPIELLERIEAVAALGTLAARDLLLAKLVAVARPAEDIADFPAEKILEALQGAPLHGEAARFVLSIARSEVSTSIRVAAVRALSNCQDDITLRRLVDMLCLDEPEPRVRLATLETLLKNEAVYGLRRLLEEGIDSRPDEDERRRAWDYVLSCAANAGGDSPLTGAGVGGIADLAEPAIIRFLRDEVLHSLHAHVARGCKKLRHSPAVSELLLRLARDRTVPTASRAAACEALAEATAPAGAAEALRAVLDQTLGDSDQAELAAAAAAALAAIAPTMLTGDFDPRCVRALWKKSLERGLLIYEDRIVVP